MYAVHANARKFARHHSEGKPRHSVSMKPASVLANRTHFIDFLAETMSYKVYRRCKGLLWRQVVSGVGMVHQVMCMSSTAWHLSREPVCSRMMSMKYMPGFEPLTARLGLSCAVGMISAECLSYALHSYPPAYDNSRQL